MSKVIVVGGGPAGMMAAAAAAQSGLDTVLLEQNEKLGKKLFITGKGRCNVTNACDEEEFLKNVRRNPRFCYSAIYTFPPEKTVALIEKNGVPLKTERGRRVFPQSDKSSDIIRALSREVTDSGVKVRLNTRLENVLTAEGRVTGVRAGGTVIPCDAVVLALGGRSYTSTGSDGKWVPMVEKFSHSVTPLRPSLVPLVSRAEWVRDLQGLSLKNVTLTARLGKKTVMNELGEMLFTHFGFSGPLILTLSALIEEADLEKLSVTVDLKPGLTREQLDKRLLRDFAAYGSKELKNACVDLLPSRLIAPVLACAGLDARQPVANLTGEAREKLVSVLKGLPLPIDGFASSEEAIVTRGGVNVRELDPSTMQSKLVRGLFFAGEMTDVDALTGGYNIQLALATGYLAGSSIKECL